MSATSVAKQTGWHRTPLLLLALAPSVGHAADDTFACLETFEGPLVRIEGQPGAPPLERLTWPPATRFDARGASFISFLDSRDMAALVNCYPVELGADWRGCVPERFDLYDDASHVPPPAPPVCFAGGRFVGTQSPALTWRDVKFSQAMAITMNAERAVVDGVRIHNHQDAIVPLTSGRFEVRNSWITNNRDDAIENDAFASGLIDDNLIDGTFVFLSMVNRKPANPPVADGPDGLVRITNNLVHLQNMPGPGKAPWPEASGYAHAFKTWGEQATRVALHGNVFLFDPPGDSGRPEIRLRQAELASCSDNVLIWSGEGGWPVVPDDDCFEVTTDLTVWTRARRNWINCHPKLMRLPRDPRPKPEACDPAAPGGG